MSEANRAQTEPDIPESKRHLNPGNVLYTDEPGFEKIGTSAGGHPLLLKNLNPESGNWKGRVLLLGGVHGNETEGVAFMEGFCREFALGKETVPFDCEVTVYPVMNPDGFLAFERQNANGVDLNRNMATKDWQAEALKPKYFPGKEPNSEPETKALLRAIEMYPPDFIISFHSWKPMVNVNGPAHSYAKLLSEKLNYIITEDIGYPTPGSLGTWAGWERGIPTITLEFERGIDLDGVYSFARDGVLDAIRLVSQNGRD